MIPMCDEEETTRTAHAHVTPGCRAGQVSCRCCPGGISRSGRAPRYPSDMSDAEWAVIEPRLPEPGWKQGRAAGRALPP
jgi:hypothetical protein